MKLNKFKTKYHFKEVDSTSLILREQICNVRNFTFLSADYQTNGRGRTGHSWVSNEGDNLLFSFVIKNKKILKYKDYITLSMGAILYSFFANKYDLSFYVKWPNDLYINDKKFIGVIAEGTMHGIIVGVGININQTDFGDLCATSLRNEIGNIVNINKLKKSLFSYIKNELNKIDNKYTDFILLINKHNYLKDKEISFIDNDKKYVGIVKEINSYGELIVDIKGTEVQLSSGEVNTLRIQP